MVTRDLLKTKMSKGLDSLNKVPPSLISDIIIQEFVTKTKKVLKENLAYQILFGSRARMDNNQFSDYDFLILIYQKNEEVRNMIEDIGADIFYHHSILVSCLIWSIEEWELKSKFPIGMNILKEGILL